MTNRPPKNLPPSRRPIQELLVLNEAGLHIKSPKHSPNSLTPDGPVLQSFSVQGTGQFAESLVTRIPIFIPNGRAVFNRKEISEFTFEIEEAITSLTSRATRSTFFFHSLSPMALPTK